MNNFKYEKPIDRMVLHLNDGSKTIVSKGNIAFICPRCFNIIKTKILNVFTSDDILNTIDDFCIDTIYHGTCNNCNEFNKLIEIDINMAEIISILNNKGYYTKFCCEGHVAPNVLTSLDIFSRPYIYFYFTDDVSILEKYPLPKTWSVDRDDGNFQVYDNILELVPDEISSNDDFKKLVLWLKNNWDKESRLQDIYDWACSLPDRSDEFKEFKLGVIQYNESKKN